MNEQAVKLRDCALTLEKLKQLAVLLKEVT